ncbi:MAG TPA: PIN domain-containing protein [Caulobacteraceae bacterium]
MIVADTSSLIAFLEGSEGPDADRIYTALVREELFMAPPVVAELLSKPKSGEAYQLIQKLELVGITEGYWERVGQTRALLLTKGFKAKLADALIAQCCIDAGAQLITRDSDYRHFANLCGLKLA